MSAKFHFFVRVGLPFADLLGCFFSHVMGSPRYRFSYTINPAMNALSFCSKYGLMGRLKIWFSENGLWDYFVGRRPPRNDR
jgi:hypothetical protein